MLTESVTMFVLVGPSTGWGYCVKLALIESKACVCVCVGVEIEFGERG